MPSTYRIRYTITDQANVQIPSFFLADPSDTATILDDIDAITNARTISYRATYTNGWTRTPSGAGTPNVLRAATLIFGTAVGGTVRMIVPSPDDTIFEGDHETVDLSETRIATLAADMVTFGSTRGGHAIRELQRGYAVALPVAPYSRYR